MSLESCNHQNFVVVFDSEINFVCPVCNMEGEPTVSTQCAGRFYLSERTYNIPKETFTKVPIDAVDFDIGDNWDNVNKRFIIPSDGIYLLHVAAGLARLGTNALSRIYTYVKGLQIGCMPSHIQYGSTHVWGKILLGSCPMKLNAGDYIEMYIWHNSPNYQVDICEDKNLTFLAITKIS